MAQLILWDASIHIIAASRYLKFRGLRQQRCNGLWLFGLKYTMSAGLCSFLEVLVKNPFPFCLMHVLSSDPCPSPEPNLSA